MKSITLSALCASILVAASGAAQASLVDRGGGLIYDTALNVTWLQDANYARTSGYDADGFMSWDAATAWAGQLVYGGYDDWRLPGVAPANGVSFNYAATYNGSTDAGYNITRPSSELAYNFYVNLGNQGSNTTTGAPTSCNAGSCFTNTGLFTNLVAGYGSWYGQEFWGYGYAGYGWVFDSHGYQSGNFKTVNYYAWAVRPGDVAVVPVPGAIWLLGSGLLGLLSFKRRSNIG